MKAKEAFNFLIVSLVAGVPNPKASHRRSRTSKRSEHSKRDSGHYLTYYQSSLADGRSDTSDPVHRIKHLSVGSTSSSEYDSDSDSTNLKITENIPPSRARMRSGIPSDGGSDRRRVAIVEVDVESSELSQHHRRGSILARRGLQSSLAGLALVAPPDAAPNTYSHLTPPSTAPLSADTIAGDQGEADSEERSAQYFSDSREQTFRTASPSRQPRIFVGDNTTSQPTALYHPVARHRSSRSPNTASDGSDRYLLPQYARTPATRGSSQPLIKTPDIGEEKDINIRVAAPVVISLESTEAIRRGKSLTGKLSQMASHPNTALPSPPIGSVHQPGALHMSVISYISHN